MRMRKKPNLIPRMERCAAALVQDPVERRGEWRGLMPGCTALRLELGCGKGRFTAETAAASPAGSPATAARLDRCASTDAGRIEQGRRPSPRLHPGPPHSRPT